MWHTAIYGQQCTYVTAEKADRKGVEVLCPSRNKAKKDQTPENAGAEEGGGRKSSMSGLQFVSGGYVVSDQVVGLLRTPATAVDMIGGAPGTPARLGPRSVVSRTTCSLL